MTYKVKQNKLEDLKNGRTIKYIAERCDCTPEYISKIFLDKSRCSKALAFLIVSIRDNSLINDLNVDETIDFYFDKIDT